MKITAFNPLIVTKDAEAVVGEEGSSFSTAHSAVAIYGNGLVLGQSLVGFVEETSAVHIDVYGVGDVSAGIFVGTAHIKDYGCAVGDCFFKVVGIQRGKLAVHVAEVNYCGHAHRNDGDDD